MASTTPRKAATRKTAARKTTPRKPASASRNGSKPKAAARKAVAGSVGSQASTATRYDQALGAAKTAIDVPVGVALTVRDQLTERVGELIGPFTARETAEKELRSYRTQLTRRLNKAERRGATTRTQATRSVKRTQTQVERELRRRRRQAETTLRRNRRQAETAIRQNRRRFERQAERIQADLGSAVQSQTARVQEIGANVVQQVTTLV